MQVRKRNGKIVEFDLGKIEAAVKAAYSSCGLEPSEYIFNKIKECFDIDAVDILDVEDIQDAVESLLMFYAPYSISKAFILYREQHKNVREFVKHKKQFINNYKISGNTADATIDDNSNVGGKSIGILNAEIHKEDNIQISRGMVMDKLQELYPDFDSKQYLKDLEHHIIYKHDESSFAGAIAPYCCSITMYPFLNDGIKSIGGLSAHPKNLDSFCGMYVNLIFATAAQFAGAVATSEFLLYFDYFAKKEWGNDYYKHPDTPITVNSVREKTISSQIHQYFQQVIYSINQPAASRGLQSAFVNFSYFDKYFFEGMFGDFVFPDGEKPEWESLCWLQKDFMQWFNAERLKTIITFPVESFALVYKDGKFLDQDSADFVAEEYARGHSFFTYISDSVDSLSSCCFSGDTKVLWKTSYDGIHSTTLKELYDLKWEPYKKNLRIFHNGSWVSGKAIKIPHSGKMYRVETYNNKVYELTDNHINVTLDGEKETSQLTTDDYLMFNTSALSAIPESDEHLTYAQGYVIGLFLGDGSFGPEIKGTIYETVISQNEQKHSNTVRYFTQALSDMGLCNRVRVDEPHNNVINVRVSCKELVAFIIKWTNWFRGTYAYNKKLNLNCLAQSTDFRKGILDGWYSTDGGNSNRCYTTSKELAESMEIVITSLGMNSIIDISDRTDEEVVIREEVYDRNYPLYCVRWYSDGNHRQNKDANHSWIKRNNSTFFRIKSIEEIPNQEEVYCIECTNKDEPYFTLPSGLITHNCRLKNMVTTKEFNFTNGNMGVQTGSKSVITLNLNRIIQDWKKDADPIDVEGSIKQYLINILDRIYKYHTAYNALLHDMYDAGLLPVYSAGFINLDKQYLTIGINGLNQAAEFLGIECSDNEQYSEFCKLIFSTIKEQNLIHKTKTETFNTECVPAESLAIKNYNWDKADGYKVPEDTNLYASYIFKPNDDNLSVMDKIRLHGANYIGDYLDGGAAAHINLDSHLSKLQYRYVIEYAAMNGCQYFTFNIPNAECEDCGFIAKQPFTVCPKCGSTHISLYDRVIGYLTKISNWSSGRQLEQKTRIYSHVD